MDLMLKLGVLACLTVVAAACGSDGGGSGGGATSVQDASLNYKSGNCGSQVIADYNNMVLKCKYMTASADATNCKSTAQSFLSKYPGVSCAAQKPSDTSVDSTPTTVQASDIQAIVDKLTAAGY